MSDFQPPAAPSGGPSGPRAGVGTRFGAVFIDGLVLAIPYLIVIAIFGAALGRLVIVLIQTAYFTYFESQAAGQTIGKKVMKIRVIDMQTGGSLDFQKALIRAFGRIASQIVCGLGYFWAIWDKEKQTWHDKIAGTVVVPESAYPVS